MADEPFLLTPITEGSQATIKKKSFNNRQDAQSGKLWLSCAGPEAGFDDPCEFLSSSGYSKFDDSKLSGDMVSRNEE